MILLASSNLGVNSMALSRRPFWRCCLPPNQRLTIQTNKGGHSSLEEGLNARINTLCLHVWFPVWNFWKDITKGLPVGPECHIKTQTKCYIAMFWALAQLRFLLTTFLQYEDFNVLLGNRKARFMLIEPLRNYVAQNRHGRSMVCNHWYDNIN